MSQILLSAFISYVPHNFNLSLGNSCTIHKKWWLLGLLLAKRNRSTQGQCQIDESYQQPYLVKKKLNHIHYGVALSPANSGYVLHIIEDPTYITHSIISICCLVVVYTEKDKI